MKSWKTKIALASAVAVVSFGSVSTLAASWVIAQVSVPGGGKTKTDFNHGNSKESKDSTASFNGDVQKAALGMSVRIVNSSEAPRSGWVKLKIDSTTRDDNNSGVKGYYYYGQGKTHNFEPSTQAIKFHFSPDKK